MGSGGKLPTDPFKGNSHINLKDLGYDPENNPIEDIRFVCANKSKKNPAFAHFKTDDASVKEILTTGECKKINDKMFEGHVKLDKPGNAYFEDTDFPDQKLSDIDYVDTDTSKTTSFFDAPFANKNDNAYWSLGENMECGNKKGENEDYETTHQIYVKQPPP